jgi:hypothetical protein
MVDVVSVGVLGPVFVTFDVYLGLLSMGHGIPVNSAWFQQMVPDRTPAVPCFAYFWTFSRRESYRTGSWAISVNTFKLQTLPYLNPCGYSLSGYLKGRVFQQNPHTLPVPKTAVQSDIEFVSTDTFTKALNNFILLLPRFLDLWEHHIENGLMWKINFSSV